MLVLLLPVALVLVLVLVLVLLLRLCNGAQEGGRACPQLDRERRQGQPPKYIRARGGPWQGSGKAPLRHRYEYSCTRIILLEVEWPTGRRKNCCIARVIADVMIVYTPE